MGSHYLAYIPDSQKQSRRARWQLMALVVGLVLISVLLWKFTALAELAEPARLAALLEDLRTSPWSAAALVALFIGGVLALFPITALYVATAMILDTPLAICVSMIGAVSSALVGYGIGARYFRNAAATAAGWRMAPLQEILRHSGLLAIAMARFLPVAPYLVFSIAAGAVSVRLRDFVGGTALAAAPVIVLLTLFEEQVRTLVTQPTALGFAMLLGLIALWVTLIVSLRRIIARKASR